MDELVEAPLSGVDVSVWRLDSALNQIHLYGQAGTPMLMRLHAPAYLDFFNYFPPP